MTDKKEYHITITIDGQTAVDCLSEKTCLSRQKIKQAMQSGAVWLTKGKFTQRLRRAKKHLALNDELHFYHNASVLETKVAPAKLVSDEGVYSVWDKPYGMLSQGSKWGDHCTINRWAEKNLQPERPAFVVHRLDRAANGLIMLAHTKRMATSLSDLFEQRKIEKHYRVWVIGCFKGEVTVDNDLYGKSARSHISPIQYDEILNRSLLDVHIVTGRKHQIRLHLSQLGFPVVGDRLYGLDGDQQQENQHLQLTAYSLKFMCPVDAVEKIFQLGT